MKTLLIIVIFLISFQLNVKAIDIDFTKFPTVYNSESFEYFSSVGDSKIYISKQKILITQPDKIIFEKEFSDVAKLELFNLNKFDIFLYCKDIQNHKFVSGTSIKFLDKNLQQIGKIEKNNNIIEIEFLSEYKSITLNSFQNRKHTPETNTLPLAWSTIFGGNSDDSFSSILWDKQKYVYSGGLSKSNFVNDLLPINFSRGGADMVLTKFSLDGTIQWIALIGSSGNDYCMNMALDSLGNIWIAGESYGNNFYTTSNAVQNTFGGSGDGVILKFDSTGKVLYSSYFGGNAYDSFVDICIDKTNNACLTGRTISNNYPVTSGAYHSNKIEYYESPIVKFSNDGKLIYSGLFGGITNGALTLADCIIADSQNNIIIGGYSNSPSLPTTSNSFKKYLSGGYDSFITKFDNNFLLQWCTYVGGSLPDYGSCLTVDYEDNIILNSYTSSFDLPVINSNLQNSFGGAIDNYLTKFNKDGNLLWSSYFGGNMKEGEDYNALVKIGGNLKVNDQNDIYFYFRTQSNDLTTDLNSLYPIQQGKLDGFILKIDKDSKYLSSTYFGGQDDESASDIEMIDDSSFVICGGTRSKNFPLVNSYKTERDNNFNDGFIAYFGLGIAQPKPDTTLPFISASETGPCNTFWKFIVSDTSDVNVGMKNSYEVQILDNCSINTSIENNQLIVTITLLNTAQSGKFEITVFNKNGKKLVLKGDLSVENAIIFSLNPSNLLDCGGAEYLGKNCRKLRIANLTDKTQIIEDLPLALNLDFAIPQSQFPITILPKDSAEVLICFAPTRLNYGELFDTLKIQYPCFSQNIILKGELLHSQFSANSKCEVEIAGKTTENNKIIGKAVPLMLFTYFTGNEINLQINKSLQGGQVHIFDILAQEAVSFTFPENIQEYKFNCNGMVNGVYFIHLTNQTESIFQKIMIFR